METNISTPTQEDVAAATAEEVSSFFPAPAAWDFSKCPTVVAENDARDGSLLGPSNFYRDCRWSPDGSSLLTVAEDRTARLFTLPPEVLSLGLDRAAYNASPRPLRPTLTLPQQSAIYSTLWFPSASLAYEGSYCFLLAGEGTPIRLIDGIDGRIRASYPIIDHRERFIAPHAMAFNSDATKLYCGFQDAIEVFDVNAPGEGLRWRLTPSKKTKSGQKGIISALAFNPDQSGVFAAGSYARSISLYSESTGEKQLLSLKGLEGSGVTQLKFHPFSTNILYSASRRSPSLAQSWDIRNPKHVLESFARPEASSRRSTSNQRMWFDLDSWGRYLVAGDEAGFVSMFDIGAREGADAPEPGVKTAGYTFAAGKDAVPSANLHPHLPLIATVCGARHPPPSPPSSESESDSSSSSQSSEDVEQEAPSRTTIRRIGAGVTPRETTLKVWSVSAPAVVPLTAL